MKKKVILVVLFIASLCYFGWKTITTPRGEQKVQYTEASKECFAGDAKKSWKYCIYTAKQGTSGDLAYLLHGRNLDENIWNDDTFYTAQLQKYWADEKVQPPKIVTVSFGPVWLLTPKMSLPDSGLLNKFTDEIIPAIENKVGKPKRRLVFGESMGGINSLVLALTTKNIFAKVAAVCPVIYKTTPFVDLSDVKNFLERTGADPRTILGIRILARKYVSNDEEWKKISPIELLETATPSDVPELYLSCGLYDKYGNYEAVEYFAERAKSKNIKVLWRPMYGDHCVVDVKSLGDFITN
ncbi:esterase [Bdellovibrio sp. qaytius]|nr:esterase [Bdellovibrio sp. qaytius]